MLFLPPGDGDLTLVVFRYLIREILITMLAVAFVLLLIIMGSRFIRYFAQAAAGQLPVSLVGDLMLFHLPSFVQLIMPLAFFLGFLMAYGQLYMSSEMTVLQACGYSPSKLLSISLWPGVIAAILVGMCSLWLTPAGLSASAKALDNQKSHLDFSVLTPGRFQNIGHRTVYASHLADNNTRLQQVFISEDHNGEQILTRAEEGYQFTDPHTHSRYLQLSNGVRYVVTPGSEVAQKLSFGSYAFLVQTPQSSYELNAPEMLPTTTLLATHDDDALGQLEFRISLALMIPILAVLAMSLSKVNPRHGRFAKLLPAIVLFVIYLSLLIAAQNMMHNGKLSPMIGVWPIHIVFLALGVWLLRKTFGKQRVR